jgi:small GTP-binding protein
MIPIKVVIAGPAAVGKTVACGVYVTRKFMKTTKTTIGLDIRTKSTSIGKAETKVQLWELGGQDRFGTIRKTFYIGLGAIILMLDLTRPGTLESARKYLTEEIAPCVENQEYGCAAIVGNKLDLSDKRQVSDDEIENLRAFAEDLLGHRTLAFTTSATNPESIEKMFSSVVECSLTVLEAF